MVFVSFTSDAYINPAETGLYYLKSRYYDAEVGRFINADGYVSTGTGLRGYNMYAYCNDNPVKHKDSDGNCITNAKGDTYHYNCGYQFRYNPYLVNSVIASTSKGKEVLEGSFYLGNRFVKSIYNTTQRPANIGKGTFERNKKYVIQNIDDLYPMANKIFEAADKALVLWEISNNCCENVMNNEEWYKVLWDFTVDSAILSANVYMGAAVGSAICPGPGSLIGFAAGIAVDGILDYFGDGAREELKAWVN